MRLVPRDLSIERKLPVLVGTLLLAVVLGLSGAAYREVRRAARLIAAERIGRATRELADLFQRSAAQRIAETRTLAADSAVRAFRTAGAPRAPALAALRRVAPENAPNTAVELRDAGGRVLLRSGDSALGPAPAPTPTDSVVVGPLRVLRDTVLGYDVRAPVTQGGRVAGQVIQVRRINLSAQTQQTLRALTGGDVILLYGNAGGDPWTDFAGVIPAPGPEVRGSHEPIEYRRGEAKLGAAALVRGTPWMFIAELPRSQVFAPAQAYLVRMALIAGVIVALGGVAAWWVSRRITTPLRRLTAAAEGIAAGAPAQRVPPGSRDELGRLATAFNVMAERVEHARRGLEAEVAERTRELQQAKDQLERTSEERYRHLFHRNPLPMWVYDQKTLAFLDVNEAAIRRYGWSREEFLRMTIKDIRPADDVARLVETLAHVPGGLFEAGIWRHRKKDGSIIDVEVTRHHLQIGGRAVGLVLAHDITARLAAERALRESEEALRRLNAELEARVQQRTAELESFSYSISHDLRAPLRAIDGFSRLLLEDHAGELGPEASRLLEVVRSNTQRMGRLIDDLLAFSRLGRREPVVARVDMTALAREVAEEVRRTEGDRTVELVIHELEPAQADPALLRQVWANLIGNALKFSRRRGDARVEIGSRPDGREMVYYVRDNGAGFDMRYADQLFGVFQRLHRLEEFEGTGVGLAIVRRVVQRHGGRVWAEGRVDAGATFYFSLPTGGESTA